ncbi:MAG: hypothetical protein LUC49_08065 [Prevotella sp.]|nr:hypothetical protein [Prevotella sp.]
MKKYIKPSIETQTVEFGLMADPSPAGETKIYPEVGEEGITKGTDDWEEADDFGW